MAEGTAPENAEIVMPVPALLAEHMRSRAQ